jgi:hypothetical protein
MDIQVKNETLPLESLQVNPLNPRVITDKKLNKLVKSIKELPEMINVRPIVVNEDNVILGGNMRYKALQKLGYKDVEVIKVYGLTEDQQKTFLIKDNTPYGEWNWETLLNGRWNIDTLEDWGVELPTWKDTTELDMDFTGVDIVNKKSLKLMFTETEYPLVMEALQRVNKDHNLALLTLLEL